MVGRLADVALAREEHQHVVLRRECRERGGYVAREVALLAVRRLHVPHLDGEEPSRDRYRRRAVEEGGEALGVERCGGDDHLQVAAFREDALEDAEEEVDVERALVRFVDDDRVVGAEEGICARLGEKDSVGHELDAGGVGEFSREPVLVSDCRADLASELLGDAFRDSDRGEAAWLGAGDAPSARAESEFHRHLRQLGGLSRARVPAYYHDLVRL